MICKKTYLAARKQRHNCCPDCIQSEPHIFKNQVEQKHCCRQCKKVLFTKIKNVTQNIPEFVYDKTCDDCKEKNKQAASKRMMLNNPSYKNKSYSSIEDAKTTKKLKQENKRKYKTKDEMKAAFSERMKQNNPMFNIDSRQKARETLKKRIEAGEITYNWKNSKYYKGDRGIKNYIRISLTWWRKENFERTSYTCECCGSSGGYLCVHHLEKFSDIVERFANELELDLKTLDYNSENYQKLEKLVNDYHKNNNIGIVVCENCHDKIDKCFHKRKFLRENKNERDKD